MNNVIAIPVVPGIKKKKRVVIYARVSSKTPITSLSASMLIKSQVRQTNALVSKK